MKVTFVVPAIGKKPGQRYIGTWKMEPLTVAALQALTPPDVETELFDDRLELIDYDTATDLVALPLETYTARRAYAIAARFRARGVRVVMGGYHATLAPDETAEHADAVVVGNAESVWATLLADAASGRLRRRYEGGVCAAPPPPDKRIFAGKRYLPVGLVETGRGCGHVCEFCAIAGFYRHRYHPRPVDDIAADLERSPHRYQFLVDDNLMADREHLTRLADRIAPLGKKWAGQGTLDLARDPALLARLKRSGCELILIGFESLEDASLRQMRKPWNAVLGERSALVRRIHDAGIGIYATFVFGYDGDTAATFERTLEFAEEARFFTAAFNHLLPFPGTPLYDRLAAEGRLLHDKWWLAEGYSYGQVAFRPATMSAEELASRCRDARKRFAAPRNLGRRGLASLRRSAPREWPLFWAMNTRLGEEVDEKMNVPLAANLDAWPK
nr:B12-binding domain-containing radical SAM protein [Propionibacterium sp.]